MVNASAARVSSRENTLCAHEHEFLGMILLLHFFTFFWFFWSQSEDYTPVPPLLFQDKEKYKVRSESILGTGELLSLWSRGASPSWCVDVFGHLEDLQTPYYWDFMEASSLRDE